MNKKSTSFFLVTLAVAAAAWYISHVRAPETNVGTPPLFPALADHVNDVVRVEVKSRLNDVSLSKDGAIWVVDNRDKYPALFDRVKRAILDLSEMKIIESKTSQPELYSRLGVEDVDGARSASTLITLEDKDGRALASLLVGKQREGRPGPLGALRYVRRAGEAQSYLVAGDLDINADPLSWIHRELADIGSARIRSVRIEQPGLAPVEVDREKPGDPNLTLQDVPDGFQPKSTAVVTSLSTILEQLRFDDVRSAAALKWPDNPDVATLRGFDGLVATIRTASIDGRQYSTLEFGYDPAGVVQPPAADAKTPADKPAAPSGEDKPKPVPDEVKALNAEVKGWAFVLPDFKVQMLTSTMDGLIIRKQTPKAPIPEPALPKDPLKVEHFDKNGNLIPAPQTPAPPAAGVEGPAGAAPNAAPAKQP